MLIKLNVDSPKTLQAIEELKSHSNKNTASGAVLWWLENFDESWTRMGDQFEEIEMMKKQIQGLNRLIEQKREAVQILLKT